MNYEDLDLKVARKYPSIVTSPLDYLKGKISDSEFEIYSEFGSRRERDIKTGNLEKTIKYLKDHYVPPRGDYLFFEHDLTPHKVRFREKTIRTVKLRFVKYNSVLSDSNTIVLQFSNNNEWAGEELNLVISKAYPYSATNFSPEEIKSIFGVFGLKRSRLASNMRRKAGNRSTLKDYERRFRRSWGKLDYEEMFDDFQAYVDQVDLVLNTLKDYTAKLQKLDK